MSGDQAIASWYLPMRRGHLWLIAQHFAEAADWVDNRCLDRTPPGGGQPLYAGIEHSRGAGHLAAATSSAQHFFDRRDSAGRGGMISGIPLALGHCDKTVGFRHAMSASRHADLTASTLSDRAALNPSCSRIRSGWLAVGSA
jgi:hypothetical protein